MDKKLLEPRPEAAGQVYAIWLPMLPGDRRSLWRARLMEDPRITHYWDERRIAGRSFAVELDGRAAIAWDCYFLYGPEAIWKERPEPLVDASGPIYARRALLATRFSQLLSV